MVLHGMGWRVVQRDAVLRVGPLRSVSTETVWGGWVGWSGVAWGVIGWNGVVWRLRDASVDYAPLGSAPPAPLRPFSVHTPPRSAFVSAARHSTGIAQQSRVDPSQHSTGRHAGKALTLAYRWISARVHQCPTQQAGCAAKTSGARSSRKACRMPSEG